MAFYGSDNVLCGEPYDYADNPNYWAQRDMERMIIEEEFERNERNAN